MQLEDYGFCGIGEGGPFVADGNIRWPDGGLPVNTHGGNLSEALSNLSGVLRDRQMLAMKVKALSAEAKASAMVLASLPPGVMIMVYISTPDYIMPLFTTMPGRFLVAVGAVWMLTGVLIMRKMINFKF